MLHSSHDVVPRAVTSPQVLCSMLKWCRHQEVCSPVTLSHIGSSPVLVAHDAVAALLVHMCHHRQGSI